MTICRFLPLQDVDELRQIQLFTSHVLSSKAESCIIIGGQSFLRTSLLFQAALSYASDSDQVIFICPSPLMQKPLHVSGMIEPTPLVLECIKMVYITDPAGLLKYLCEFHKTQLLPVAIIIDDLQHYISHHSQDQSKEAALVKLFAMLEDTTGYISEKRGQPCHRIVSLNQDVCQKNIIKRFFGDLWHMDMNENKGHLFLTDDRVPAFRVELQTEGDKQIIMNKMYRLPVIQDGE
ncbi:hypothetical protein X975_26977, partial [Stegodyphus mimosarum]